MADFDVDILIIGGGLTGAMLYLALSKTPFKTLLIDSKSADIKVKPDFDARSLALSPATISILKTLGVWEALSAYATPIKKIHVSEQKQFGLTRIQQQTEEPLGYVVEMQSLNQVIQPLLSEKDLIAPAKLTDLDSTNHLAFVKVDDARDMSIRAKLIVAADGTNSFVRKKMSMDAAYKSYGQSAVVANIGLARSHENIAYERFTHSGPMALLPMSQQRSALVWSLPSEKAEQIMALDDKDFAQALQQAFGYRLGRFTKVGKRSMFPLQQVIMKKQIAWPTVFIGNAAHTLHPVAGQGFNLGLRDVALLAQCLIQQGISQASLAHYQSLRRHDQKMITWFTDSLVELFTSSIPGLSKLRGYGLLALDNIKPLKSMLARYASGYGGVVPDLVCQIPLSYEDKE